MCLSKKKKEHLIYNTLNLEKIKLKFLRKCVIFFFKEFVIWPFDLQDYENIVMTTRACEEGIVSVVSALEHPEIPGSSPALLRLFLLVYSSVFDESACSK